MFPPTGPCSVTAASLQTSPSNRGRSLVLAQRIKAPFERDLTLGEGARLVSEQNLDIAEVLDSHQPLHEHLLRRQSLGSRGEADRDDGRHHLGRDAHGYRQGEEQRFNEWPRERHVDDEDERGQHRCHPEQEAGEARQTNLEGRLALMFGQSSRDPPEGGPGTRLDHHAEGRPLVNDRSHEGTAWLVLWQAPRDGRHGFDHGHRLPGQDALRRTRTRRR